MAANPSPFWAGFLGMGAPHVAAHATPDAVGAGPSNGQQPHAPLARTFSGTFAPSNSQADAPNARPPRSLFGERAIAPRLDNPRTNTTAAVMADQLQAAGATSGHQLAPHQAMAQAMGTAAAMVTAVGDGTAAAPAAVAVLDAANQMTDGDAIGQAAVAALDELMA